MLTAAGCTDTCLLNGECPGASVCIEGDCRRPCVLDTECPIEQLCLSGGCRALAPGERAPCRDDSGCLEADMQGEVDATTDAGADMAADGAGDREADAIVDIGPAPDGATADDAVLDGAMLDGDRPDGSPFDGAVLDGGPDASPDGAPPGDAGLDAEAPADAATDAMRGPFDGGLGVDLTGLYAVTTTVVVVTGGELAQGDELRHIHRLDWLGGTRYRLEVYATDGVFEHDALVDLASPDGPERYQYEYILPIPAPAGCEAAELRFQRGRYEVFPPGYRLLAGEERTVGFEGPDCAADGYLVRVDTVWVPLPPP